MTMNPAGTITILSSLRLGLILSSLLSATNAFTSPSRARTSIGTTRHTPPPRPRPLPAPPSTPKTPSARPMAYAPPEDAEKSKPSSPKPPKPKIGDVVLYYDVDGGDSKGEALVGKISLIQPILGGGGEDDTGKNKWLVEITQMEDAGDGYYAERPSRKRRKSALRKLECVRPLPASFVRGERAYKVPTERGTGRPLAARRYDLAGYEGPSAVPVDADAARRDGEEYDDLKAGLVRDAALAGAAGTVLADLLRGAEDATIYAAGAAAGAAYLFFLGIKTDTLGSPDAKLGSGVSNLRFVFPALVLAGVALENASGARNPVVSPGIFSTVTPEQFAAAMIGFLTYRVPLFASQLFPVIGESASDILPGSAGMALRVAQEAKKRGVDASSLDGKFDDGLVTVLMVSGPEGTGKTTLVNRLLEEDDRFVRPIWSDRVADGIKFERMEGRGEFLHMDETGRYGLPKEGVLRAAEKASSDGDSKKVVVIDADVPLAKKLVNVSGARIIGVWVGLDSIEKFEYRFKLKLESGKMVIPEGESEDSVFRAKENRIVKDIEFGVVSGVFDFTILNDDLEESVKELKKAASYCFK